MNNSLSLLVNGINKWYLNLVLRLAEHDHTWLQQSADIKPQFRRVFDDQMRDRGFFWVFGHAQGRHRAAVLRFKADCIVAGSERVPPPDQTAPAFDLDYDIDQGKCEGEHDFKYVTWIRVVDCRSLPKPLRTTEFLNANVDPAVLLRGVRRWAHYYVYPLPSEESMTTPTDPQQPE